MELIEVFWCIFGIIMGFICCHFAYKGTEDVGDNQRDSERELDRDSDVRIYVPNRIRSRRGDNGRNKPLGAEEKAIVLKVILHDFDKMLTPREKEVLEAIADEQQDETDEEDVDVDGAFQGLDQAVERFGEAMSYAMTRFGEALRTWRGSK